MKQIILTIICIILVISCSENSHIPNTSIIDEIPTNQLAEVLEYEKNHPYQQVSFKDIYTRVRKFVNNCPEVDKAKYLKLTYRELYNSILEVGDTTLNKKINDEWLAKYNELLPRAKQEGKEFFTNIAIGVRNEFAKCDYIENRNFDVNLYLRSNKLLKYYKYPIYYATDLWDERHWNYIEYIHSFIDESFTYESDWTHKRALETIKDKYPNGYQFLMDRFEEYEEYIHQNW